MHEWIVCVLRTKTKIHTHSTLSQFLIFFSKYNVFNIFIIFNNNHRHDYHCYYALAFSMAYRIQHTHLRIGTLLNDDDHNNTSIYDNSMIIPHNMHAMRRWKWILSNSHRCVEPRLRAESCRSKNSHFHADTENLMLIIMWLLCMRNQHRRAHHLLTRE